MTILAFFSLDRALGVDRDTERTREGAVSSVKNADERATVTPRLREYTSEGKSL